jgi:hypothetical protein
LEKIHQVIKKIPFYLANVIENARPMGEIVSI